ncbi:MAG: transposase [bacterium]
MPKSKRIILPDCPHHIVQRGHNRQVIFADNEDFKNYLENLQELKVKYEIKIFAYCLMTNHIHLLLQPGEKTKNLGNFMKTLAARTTRYFNMLEGRSGTLWESKYKSSIVQSEQYLLVCTRYIELNPVRASITEYPEDYPWSSYIARMGGSGKEWLDIDPMFLSLGETEAIRRENYLKFIGENIPSGESEFIRTALKREQLTGNSRFIDAVEQIVGRRVERRGQGRPFNSKKSKDKI